MFFFPGDGGFQSAVIGFGLLAGYRFFAGTGYRFTLVSADGVGLIARHGRSHIAAHRGGQVFADRIGHVFRSGVHQVFGGIRNGAVFGLIGDIRSGLFRRSGIGAVSYRAGDVVQLLFHGRGFRAGRVLDFLEERIHFLPEGGRIAVVIGHDIAGFRCRLGSYVGFCPILHGIGHGILVVITLFHGAFRMGLRMVANIGNLLADFVGGKDARADGFVIPGILVTSVFIKRRFRSQLFRTSVKVLGMDFSAGDCRVVIGINTAGQGPGIEFASDFQVAADFGIASSRYGCGFNGSDVGQVAAL